MLAHEDKSFFQTLKRLTKQSGRGSSQSTFDRQMSCKMRLPFREKGEMNPKGSKTELTVLKIPRRVTGLSAKVSSKRKRSDFIDHCIPSTRSEESNDKSTTDFARSAIGSEFTTSGEFETNLVKLIPPFWQSFCEPSTSCIAEDTSGTDFKPSST